MALVPGSTLGAYRILAVLGSGGMGEVYRARDLKLNRDVALKVLLDAAASDPDRIARFTREAQVLASLNHPSIAAIHGLEDSTPTYALVLELVDGVTLAERIAAGPIPIDDALSIAAQIVEALAAAGERGVIHRDLKPANIKLRPDGTVKVLDFGLAKLLESPAWVSGSDTRTGPGATQLGVVMGTPAYMSPEQARGLPVGKQSDIWAFGCVLFEMLTGRAVFGADTPSDSIARILEREPEWRTLPSSTPARIRQLLGKCLRKDPAQRLQDIADARIEINRARARPREGRGVRSMTALTVAGVIAVVSIGAGAWWLLPRTPTSPAQSHTRPHDPVSVIIADFANLTNEPVFDGTLEPMLRVVLEGAPFVSAYDRNAIGRSLGLRPPDRLDQDAARAIAIKQGLSVVLSGRIARDQAAYTVSVTASRAISGEVILGTDGRAENRDLVLAVAGELVTRVRAALGDDTSEETRRFAKDTLSATSLDVVRHYAAGMEALSNSRFEEALRGFTAAIERDPTFGLAYAGMAIASRNLGRQQDAEKFVKEAVRHVDGMTERERYRTRGLFYYVTGDYQQCVAEYGELVERYESDVAARNNLALCLTYLRKMSQAMEQMRRVVEILPKRALYRVNLSLYASYSGDYLSAEREARAVQEQSPWGVQALALAQTGQGRTAEAAKTYERFAQFEELGSSFAASGLADLAFYEGHFAKASEIIRRGTAVVAEGEDRDRTAWNFAVLARAEVAQGRVAAAIAAVDRALSNSQGVKIRFLSGLVLTEANAFDRAMQLAAGLTSELQVEPRSYGRIIEGEIARRRGDTRTAIKSATEALQLLDTWVGHFMLGRANLDAGAFVQADAEFDRCIRRRGEALALFLDEEPTAGFLPTVYFYQGRARDGMGAGGSAESYQAYLSIRGGSKEDPLVRSIHSLSKQ